MAFKKASSQKQVDDAAAELKKKIQAYFEEKDALDKFPSEPGMRVYLGMSKAEVEKACERPEYAAVFELARDMREAWLTEHAVDSKFATGCMNLLKQPSNGGYLDKSQNVDSELKIKIVGQGTDPTLFD